MCGVKLKDRFPSRELRERLGIDDIALVYYLATEALTDSFEFIAAI